MSPRSSRAIISKGKVCRLGEVSLSQPARSAALAKARPEQFLHPIRLLPAALNHDAHLRRRLFLGIDHPNFVVDQMHLSDRRVMLKQRLAQRQIQRCHRPITFGHAMLRLLPDVDLHRRLGDRLGAVGSKHDNPIMIQLKKLAIPPDLLSQQ